MGADSLTGWNAENNQVAWRAIDLIEEESLIYALSMPYKTAWKEL
jgi:hypothetical protein